jgi:hypothetical protein
VLDALLSFDSIANCTKDISDQANKAALLFQAYLSRLNAHTLSLPVTGSSFRFHYESQICVSHSFSDCYTKQNKNTTDDHCDLNNVRKVTGSLQLAQYFSVLFYAVSSIHSTQHSK